MKVPRKKPVVRRTKKWKPRKRLDKSSYVGRGAVIHPSVSSPLPQTFKCNLRYTEYNKFAALGVSTDTYVLRANSAYDPDYSFGGHQPRGWDQLSQMYNKYVVLGSKLTVTFNNQLSTPVIVGIAEMNSPTATTHNEYIEGINRVTYKQLSGNTGSSNQVTVVEKHSPKRFFGISNVKDDDNLRAVISANPVNNAYWHMFCYDMGMATVSNAVYYTYQIEYIILFSEPVRAASS